VVANLERLRFYVDESALGLGKTLAAARDDVIHAGHPLIPECPLGTLDPEWIKAVAARDPSSSTWAGSDGPICFEAGAMNRCRVCGASLEGRRRQALTCSASCRREASRQGDGPYATLADLAGRRRNRANGPQMSADARPSERAA
jgi:hypothetical protein